MAAEDGWIGSAIGAAGSLLGGFLGSKSNSKAIEEANRLQMQNAEADRALQRQFATEGIRWRVADAKAAGLHPLFALGAQLPSSSPTTFIPGTGSDPMGGAIADASQHLGRAIESTRTGPERVQERLGELAITRAELENDLLRSQNALLIQQSNPPMPSAVPASAPFPEAAGDLAKSGLMVSPASSHIQEKPLERVVPNPQNPTQEPGALADVGFVKTPTGYAPVPSKDAKERIEDQLIPEAMWAIRNHLLPSFGAGNPPPLSMLPDDAYSWKFDVWRQEWQPYYGEPADSRVPVPGHKPWNKWRGRMIRKMQEGGEF